MKIDIKIYNDIINDIDIGIVIDIDIDIDTEIDIDKCTSIFNDILIKILYWNFHWY